MRYLLEQTDAAYRRARQELLAAEMALRDQRERVAALRRALPAGPALPDYVFREGPAELARNDPGEFFDTRLAELFPPGKDSLVVYHFMYGPDWEQGCPMCSMWCDGYNAVAPYIARHAGLALVARAPLEKFRAYARGRGWHELRLLSSHDSTFNRDFGMEDGADNQLPGISVFTRDAGGTVRQFYTGGAIMDEGEFRGLDLFTPVWHLLDLLPQGRGDWMPAHGE